MGASAALGNLFTGDSIVDGNLFARSVAYNRL